jgi:hypothetical protein
MNPLVKQVMTIVSVRLGEREASGAVAHGEDQAVTGELTASGRVMRKRVSPLGVL